MKGFDQMKTDIDQALKDGFQSLVNDFNSFFDGSDTRSNTGAESENTALEKQPDQNSPAAPQAETKDHPLSQAALGMQISPFDNESKKPLHELGSRIGEALIGKAPGQSTDSDITEESVLKAIRQIDRIDSRMDDALADYSNNQASKTAVSNAVSNIQATEAPASEKSSEISETSKTAQFLKTDQSAGVPSEERETSASTFSSSSVPNADEKNRMSQAESKIKPADSITSKSAVLKPETAAAVNRTLDRTLNGTAGSMMLTETDKPFARFDATLNAISEAKIQDIKNMEPDATKLSGEAEKLAEAAQKAVLDEAANLKESEEALIDLDRTIAVIMKAGVLFLEAGAEVYRAESTINRLGRSINGVKDCISYVTVTGIMLSVVTEHQTVTRIARVNGTSRNLSVINAINQLSRNAETYHFTTEQIEKILEKIQKLPVYRPWMTVICGALGALGFGIFFNGTLLESAAIFAIGILVQLLSLLMENYKMNIVFVNGVAAFGAAIASEWFHILNPAIEVDVLIISSIMLLVPGLTLTNGIRDTVMGEYLAGVVRGAEAIVIAASIAVGVGLALVIFR